MTFKLIVFFLLFTLSSNSQTPPSIDNYGAIFKVEHPDFNTDTSQPFYAVFDVTKTFEDTAIPNKIIESAARFIKLHREAGVPENSIKVTLVIHGAAIFDLLNHTEYEHQRKSNQAHNPNYDLLTALSQEGVQIILCGQTAGYRKITKTQIHPEVKIALSAMTALVQLQNEGYRLINF